MNLTYPLTEAMGLSDEALVVACCHGDQNSFALLYQRYYDKVYHKCLSMLNDADAAGDATQDSLVKAYDKIGSFRRDAAFSTWLYSITTNECLQCLRKTRRRPTVKLNDAYEMAEGESGAEKFERQLREDAALTASLHRLSQEEQQLLLMKYWQHTSVKDIQQQLGMATTSAVKMRLQRARTRLLYFYQQQID